MENESSNTQKSNQEKGDRAEKLFEQYLNDSNPRIPFYRIDQTINTRSKELQDKNISRPDYIIHTEKGIYYIDVKYRGKGVFNNEKRFIIGHDTITKMYQFQKELHQEVWLAFTNNLSVPEFYYTNMSILYEYYENFKKAYEEKFKDFDQLLIYIPNSAILYDNLSFAKGFYKEPDIKYFEKEVEYIKGTAEKS